MKTTAFLLGVFEIITLLLLGCGKSPRDRFRELYKPKPYKDVTASPEYNFSSFAGSVYRTKGKVVIADVKLYTGAHALMFLAPMHFDWSDPSNTVPGTHMLSVLPPGTRLRVERLMEDQGAWGGYEIEAALLDATNTQKTGYLDRWFLIDNRWIGGIDANTNWAVHPEMLEAEISSPSAPSRSKK